jgi:hypothetical protein
MSFQMPLKILLRALGTPIGVLRSETLHPRPNCSMILAANDDRWFYCKDHVFSVPFKHPMHLPKISGSGSTMLFELQHKWDYTAKIWKLIWIHEHIACAERSGG